ncbi:RecQ family ATP-dependent DNA helicase [Agrilactobacillus yilanensis]|uniref:ATP-dependent DNA helicase RecQ n=1 Tax=Agrilactobacillus yilanensis TaxID=2485997 RepID=A0ABW4J5F3_9LACO|nr:ATP-dependent DNA helicase RecQ [Agrilactobacillus yilanensis]
MSVDLLAALEQKFGYYEFRPGQQAIIENILQGQDTLGILPTGSGKSLCYQLPAYIQQGLTIIVSPLISLMQDQVAQLQLQGEKQSIALNSTLNWSAQKFVLTHLKNYRFLFSAPETLNRPDVLAALCQVNIQTLVIDEAHCISQWGVDFRPSYLKLGAIRQQLQPKATLMLTATATPKVQQDILEKLALPKAQKVIYSVDRPNIFFDVIQCADRQAKQAQLLTLIHQLQLPGIIYFSSRQSAETMAQLIQQQCHIPTAFYHGALSTKDRYLIQQRFMTGELKVICATNAFGMGINKADIRFVIHYHAPVSFESYLQEVGRAGRDGHQSIAILLTLPDESGRQARLLEMGLPTPVMVKAFFKRPDRFKNSPEPAFELLNQLYRNRFTESEVTQMLENKRREKNESLWAFNRFVNLTTCRRQHLVHYFGEQQRIVHDDQCCALGFDTAITATLEKLKLYHLNVEEVPSDADLNLDTLEWPQVLKHIFE